MLDFTKLTSVKRERTMALPPERCHFKSGDLVRVTDGAFTGGVPEKQAGPQDISACL